MHTTYHLGISFPHDIILSLLLILAFLNSVSALVTLRVSLRGCFEARVAGKRTTVKNNTGPNLGDPKRDHNFDNPPFGSAGRRSPCG